MSETILGSAPAEGASRDAIHVAVIAVLADRKLMPGQRMEHGIVDPFLTTPVNAGERFWLVLFPNTITSLRHEWLHPAFPLAARPDLTGHQKWMRRWASEHMGHDYYGDDTRLSEDTSYAMAIEAGRTLRLGPYEDAREHIDSEWWGHWEAITGEAGQRDGYFSCSC